MSKTYSEKVSPKHEYNSAEKAPLSINLTAIKTVVDWRKWQLTRIIHSPYFDDLERANAGLMLCTGQFEDSEIIRLMLVRMARELKAGLKERMGEKSHGK